MQTQANTRQIEPDITVVALTGRLSLGNTLYSMEGSILKLITGGSRKLVIDLTELKYIDSAAIGVLLGCHGEMGKAGGRMRLAGANGAVEESFRIVRLEQVVPLDPDVPASCTALAGEA